MLSQLAVLSLAVVAIASPVASIKGRNLVGNGFESFNPFNAELSQNLAGSTLAKYKQTSRTPRLPMLQGLADVVSEGPVRILKGSLRTDRIKPRQASGRSSDIPLDNFSGDTLYVGDFSAGSESSNFTRLSPCFSFVFVDDVLTVCLLRSSCSTASNRFRHGFVLILTSRFLDPNIDIFH